MTEIRIENIGRYKLGDISDYLFSMSDLTRKIRKKKIKQIELDEILYLVRRKNYLEIAVLLAVLEFEENGFYGFSFRHDEKSINQRDLLKELILLDEEFWSYNQDVFNRLLPIVKENKCHLNISEKYSNEFIHFSLRPIKWTSKEIDWIKSAIEADHTSSVHSALEQIRKLKRALDNDTTILFCWDDTEYVLESEKDIIEKIIPLIPYEEEFINVMKKEIRIEKTATNK